MKSLLGFGPSLAARDLSCALRRGRSLARKGSQGRGHAMTCDEVGRQEVSSVTLGHPHPLHRGYFSRQSAE